MERGDGCEKRLWEKRWTWYKMDQKDRVDAGYCRGAREEQELAGFGRREYKEMQVWSWRCSSAWHWKSSLKDVGQPRSWLPLVARRSASGERCRAERYKYTPLHRRRRGEHEASEAN